MSEDLPLSAFVTADEESSQTGAVLQISPDFENKAFAGCLLVVTQTYKWGVQGYVQALGEDRDTMGGQAYIRIKWEHVAYVGHVAWMVS
jgi:hypothetical protein